MLVALVAGCGGSKPQTASFDGGCLRAQVVRFSGGPGDPVRGALLGDGEPAIVLANTSDGNVCRWLPYARTLADDGHAVLLFDYSRQSPEQEEAGAVRALRKRGFDRIVAGGASEGAKAAVLTATGGAPVVGVVSLSPERYLGAIDVLPAARKVRVPVLYFTARDDTWANVSAPQLYRATRSPGTRLVELPGTAHGPALLTGPTAPRVRSAIDAFLGRLSESSP